MLLRLPLEVRDLFREWLMANYPDRADHVFKLIRDMRGGKDYDSTWGKRMKGTGPLCLDDRPQIRDGLRKARLQCGERKTTTEHFRPPQAGQRAAQAVLYRAETPIGYPRNSRCRAVRIADTIAPWSSCAA